MKTEEAVTALLGGASPLGSHAFLDEFALAYHRVVAERLRAQPEAVLEAYLKTARPAHDVRPVQQLLKRLRGGVGGHGESLSIEPVRR
jgi:hypothetical protein